MFFRDVRETLWNEQLFKVCDERGQVVVERKVVDNTPKLRPIEKLLREKRKKVSHRAPTPAKPAAPAVVSVQGGYSRSRKKPAHKKKSTHMSSVGALDTFVPSVLATSIAEESVTENMAAEEKEKEKQLEFRKAIDIAKGMTVKAGKEEATFDQAMKFAKKAVNLQNKKKDRFKGLARQVSNAIKFKNACKKTVMDDWDLAKVQQRQLEGHELPLLEDLKAKFNAHAPNKQVPEPEKMTVVVPKKVETGFMEVASTEGTKVSIRVPEGTKPGDSMTVLVPGKAVDFHAPASLLARESIRFDRDVIKVLDQMWDWVDLDGNGNIERDEYVRMYSTLYPFLHSKTAETPTPKEIHDLAIKDYVKEAFCEVCESNKLCTHDRQFDKVSFRASYFELADRWTEKISSEETLKFLKKCYAIMLAHPTDARLKFRAIEIIARIQREFRQRRLAAAQAAADRARFISMQATASALGSAAASLKAIASALLANAQALVAALRSASAARDIVAAIEAAIASAASAMASAAALSAALAANSNSNAIHAAIIATVNALLAAAAGLLACTKAFESVQALRSLMSAIRDSIMAAVSAALSAKTACGIADTALSAASAALAASQALNAAKMAAHLIQTVHEIVNAAAEAAIAQTKAACSTAVQQALNATKFAFNLAMKTEETINASINARLGRALADAAAASIAAAEECCHQNAKIASAIAAKHALESIKFADAAEERASEAVKFGQALAASKSASKATLVAAAAVGSIKRRIAAVEKEVTEARDREKAAKAVKLAAAVAQVAFVCVNEQVEQLQQDLQAMQQQQEIVVKIKKKAVVVAESAVVEVVDQVDNVMDLIDRIMRARELACTACSAASLAALRAVARACSYIAARASNYMAARAGAQSKLATLAARAARYAAIKIPGMARKRLDNKCAACLFFSYVESGGKDLPGIESITDDVDKSTLKTMIHTALNLKMDHRDTSHMRCLPCTDRNAANRKARPQMATSVQFEMLRIVPMLSNQTGTRARNASTTVPEQLDTGGRRAVKCFLPIPQHTAGQVQQTALSPVSNLFARTPPPVASPPPYGATASVRGKHDQDNQCDDMSTFTQAFTPRHESRAEETRMMKASKGPRNSVVQLDTRKKQYVTKKRQRHKKRQVKLRALAAAYPMLAHSQRNQNQHVRKFSADGYSLSAPTLF